MDYFAAISRKKQYFQFLLYIIPPPFYLHKSYLHKTTEKVHFSLNYSKENYFERFIEELGFVELSTQAKHLRA